MLANLHRQTLGYYDGAPAHGRDVFTLSGLADEDHLLIKLQ